MRQPFPTTSVQPARSADVRPRVSAIVPARDESECITAVVLGLLALRDPHGRPCIDEVVVADNGSRDDTAMQARAAGARVVDARPAGYGMACWAGVQASQGDWLLFVDGDGAADAHDAPALLQALADGADLAIGLRVRPDPHAFTAPQRFGNALACALMRRIWRMPAHDLGPHRAIRRHAFDALDMRDRAFGWTVEMQVRAHLQGLRVAQLPVHWRARIGGRSKISGTVRGVIGAGLGIVGMVARLWWRERQRRAGRLVSSPVRAVIAPAHEFNCKE